MTAKRLPVLVFSVVIFVVLAEGQNLVEAARKEKERRESLKDRRVMVVTNEDLAGLRKTPAIIVITPAETLGERAENATENLTRGSDFTPRKITPRVSEPGPLLIGAGGLGGSGSRQKNLEEKLTQVREAINGLISRMNTLRQESFSPEGEKSREMLLKQIEELTAELLKAQQEEDTLKRQIKAQKEALSAKRESR